MSYGLGQTDDEFLGAKDILMNMINATNAMLEGLADTAPVRAIRQKTADAARWWQAAIERYYAGNTKDAMESVVVGIRMLHEAQGAIRALKPEDKLAARAEAEAQKGASFPYQVGKTLESPLASFQSAVTAPVAAALESVSPAAAAAVRSAGWIVPLLGGLVLFAVLKKR